MSYVLREDWDAMGMAATGSGTILISDELFVPDDHFSTPQVLMGRLAKLKDLRTGLAARRARAFDHGGHGQCGGHGGACARGLPRWHRQEADRLLALCNRQQDAPVTHLNVGYVQMQIKAARCVAEAALDDLDRLYETG